MGSWDHRTRRTMARGGWEDGTRGRWEEHEDDETLMMMAVDGGCRARWTARSRRSRSSSRASCKRARVAGWDRVNQGSVKRDGRNHTLEFASFGWKLARRLTRTGDALSPSLSLSLVIIMMMAASLRAEPHSSRQPDLCTVSRPVRNPTRRGAASSDFSPQPKTQTWNASCLGELNGIRVWIRIAASRPPGTG
eukprot:1007152-Rhodomonas_salina.1